MTLSRAEVQALIEELRLLAEEYWDEENEDGSTEAAIQFCEKSEVILRCLEDYLQRCF